MENILQLNHVSKSYQNHIAVNDVSFDMPKGSIFGMLGPNGAGKTSLIRIITTITKADAGGVSLNGVPLTNAAAMKIGYMPEERGLYKKMKVGEQLMYLAQLKGMSKIEAKQAIDTWLQKFEISDWWNKKVEELSKGMQQKVQFIATVVHNPDLLILDEPFSGLDPINANLIEKEISELHKNGTSIIFSTHRMEQVEEICDEIVLINKGRILLSGNVKNIKNQFKEHKYKIEFEGELPASLTEKVHILSQTDNEVIIHLSEDFSGNDALQTFIQNGVQIKSFKEIFPTMNEIFIQQVEAHNKL